MVGFDAQRLIELEVENLTGAGCGERSEERQTKRNGYPERTWEHAHEVVGIAATAERALLLAGQHTTDMALMDINIRGPMNGIETAVRLKELYGISIVSVTAQTDAATRTQAMAIEPVGYLTKPYTAAELTQVVADALLSLHS
jgi:DNA-binding NarL/FixJ family response regulator